MSRALVLAAAVGLFPVAAAAQAPAVSWVNCRVIAPSTLQLIWHGLPWGRRYEVNLSTVGGRIVAKDTTADTTYTRALLPAGDLRITVVPLVRGTPPISASAQSPLGSGSARCVGT